MLTSKDILVVADILSQHTNFAYANYLYELSKMDMNSDEFVDKAGSGFIWGGMGSMLDGALCNTPQSADTIKADWLILKKFLVELAEHLQVFDFRNKKLVLSRLNDLRSEI